MSAAGAKGAGAGAGLETACPDIGTAGGVFCPVDAGTGDVGLTAMDGGVVVVPPVTLAPVSAAWTAPNPPRDATRRVASKFLTGALGRALNIRVASVVSRRHYALSACEHELNARPNRVIPRFVPKFQHPAALPIARQIPAPSQDSLPPLDSATHPARNARRELPVKTQAAATPR